MQRVKQILEAFVEHKVDVAQICYLAVSFLFLYVCVYQVCVCVCRCPYPGEICKFLWLHDFFYA